MGEIKKPLPVKLIVGLIGKDPPLFEEVEKILEEKFGPSDFATLLIPFQFTRYYEEEMGGGLQRRFLSFKRLIDPEKLPSIKVFTNKLEEKFLLPKSKKRRINIDPGYLSLSKLVLASTKDFSHRIYLGKGIYGEVTLIYHRKEGFSPLPWTYPDYRTSLYQKFFFEVRKLYQRDLKEGKFNGNSKWER